MGECLLYIVNFPRGEYLLYSKVSGGKVYYVVNIPRGRFAMRKVYYTTPAFDKETVMMCRCIYASILPFASVSTMVVRPFLLFLLAIVLSVLLRYLQRLDFGFSFYCLTKIITDCFVLYFTITFRKKNLPQLKEKNIIKNCLVKSKSAILHIFRVFHWNTILFTFNRFQEIHKLNLKSFTVK